MKRKSELMSPVRTYMQVLWDNCFRASSHSWLKLNHCLHRAMSAAVEAGMKFIETDITEINAAMRGSYWLNPEGLYTLAVKKGNTSAAISLERYFERRAWIWGGKRLTLGDETKWGEITSIHADHFIACTYKTKKSGERTKIDKRTRVTSEIFDEAARELRKAAKEAKAERMKCRHCGHEESKFIRGKRERTMCSRCWRGYGRNE